MKEHDKQGDLFYSFERIDNWELLPYDNRILDALASLFHFKGSVTASYHYGDILYVSYNEHVNLAEDHLTRNRINLLSNTNIRKILPENLLSIYLLSNVDFFELILSCFKYERDLLNKKTEHDRSIYNLFAKCGDAIKKLKKDMDTTLIKGEDINFDNYKDVNSIYYDLLNNLSKIEQNEEIKQQLFRPLQDCLKIKHYLDSWKYHFKEVILLDNKDNVHADINVVDHFPLLKSFGYIGVSRLACGYCHEYLSNKDALHRGTHGVIDPKWKMNLLSPQEEDFKLTVQYKAKKLEKGQNIFQWRKLSFDDSENKILVYDKLSLSQYKQKLNLKPLYNSGFINPLTGGLEFNKSLKMEVLNKTNLEYGYLTSSKVGEQEKAFKQGIKEGTLKGLKKGQWEGKVKGEIKLVKSLLKYKVEPKEIANDTKFLGKKKGFEKSMEDTLKDISYIEQHKDDRETVILGGLDIEYDSDMG